MVVHDDSPKSTEGLEFVSDIIKRLYSGVKLNSDEARNTEFRKTGDYEQCPMCLKNDGHSPVGCPYSVCVPKVDGKPVPVGPGCDIVCRACGGQNCFDDHGWDVRAVGKRCMFCCSSFDHWSGDCPNKLSGMEAYEFFKHKTVPIGPPVRIW